MKFEPFDYYGSIVPGMSWHKITYNKETGLGTYILKMDPETKSLHHEHTNNISAFSTYQHNFFDYLFSNVLPMYLTSYIFPLYEIQFFIFLIFKIVVEIAGHLGKIINSSSFIQCLWRPQLLGSELYARDHYIHHAEFKYNYSKRFKIWDKVFGTYKTDNKIIKKENILFNKKSIIIENEYIRYGLFALILSICYFI